MGRRGCRLAVSTAVLYGSLALFVSILHNVFLLYYVETFVSVYKIDKLSFWVGEVSDTSCFPWVIIIAVFWKLSALDSVTMTDTLAFFLG